MSLKFLQMPPAWQHKKAAEALEGNTLEQYATIALWMGLPPVEPSHEALSDRFHFHLKKAGLSRKEHRLLFVKEGDTPSDTPFLSYGVYLDSLRSGYNVGNIIRTCEALRFGTLYLSEATPGPECKKVLDAAMGTAPLISIQRIADLSHLPKPLIAVETIAGAPSYTHFDFPETGTLLLGNEEYGLSKAVLQHADACVTIPLCGSKNSLNVANAFAIIASHIRNISSVHASTLL